MLKSNKPLVASVASKRKTAENAETVPQVVVDKCLRSVSSTATTPKVLPDTCACWSPADKRAGRRLLRTPGAIHCLDATAHVAMLSLALDMLVHGRDVVVPVFGLLKDYHP